MGWGKHSYPVAKASSWQESTSLSASTPDHDDAKSDSATAMGRTQVVSKHRFRCRGSPEDFDTESRSSDSLLQGRGLHFRPPQVQ